MVGVFPPSLAGRQRPDAPARGWITAGRDSRPAFQRTAAGAVNDGTLALPTPVRTSGTSKHLPRRLRQAEWAAIRPQPPVSADAAIVADVLSRSTRLSGDNNRGAWNRALDGIQRDRQETRSCQNVRAGP